MSEKRVTRLWAGWHRISYHWPEAFPTTWPEGTPLHLHSLYLLTQWFLEESKIFCNSIVWGNVKDWPKKCWEDRHEALSTHLYWNKGRGGHGWADRCTSTRQGKLQLAPDLLRSPVNGTEVLSIGRKSFDYFSFNWLWYCWESISEKAIFLSIWEGNSMEKTREEISGHCLQNKKSFSSPGSFVRNPKTLHWVVTREQPEGRLLGEAPCRHVCLSSASLWRPWMELEVYTNVVQVVSIWFRKQTNKKKSQPNPTCEITLSL